MIDFLTSGFSELMRFVNQIPGGYIYLFLFGIAFMENIFPPIPGDTFTIIGGYLAATGKLALVPTATVILLGTVASVMVVYYIGYHGGHEYLARKNFRIFSADDLARVDRWFARHGTGTLLASRFIVGGRMAIALGAGISKYPPGPMLLYSTISSVLFHGLLIALAYGLNAYVDSIVDGFNWYNKIILAILAVVVILWLGFITRRIWHDRKKA
jgi:membrane protein DedA with SNARE-associated domain